MKQIDINYIDYLTKKGHPLMRCLKYRRIKRKRKTYKQS